MTQAELLKDAVDTLRNSVTKEDYIDLRDLARAIDPGHTFQIIDTSGKALIIFSDQSSIWIFSKYNRSYVWLELD